MVHKYKIDSNFFFFPDVHLNNIPYLIILTQNLEVADMSEAFLRSYDSAPRPPPPPPSPVSKLDWRHTGRLRKRNNLLKGERGEGAGVEPNHTTARKIGSPKVTQSSLRLPNAFALK
jgi:hypothetical protein